jgi:hypothetical protein
MKRFLGVLIASMFLASAAYAADATKEEKKADAKGKGDAVKTEGKAKSADTKAGAMGDEKKSEKAKAKTDEKAKGDGKKASK